MTHKTTSEAFGNALCEMSCTCDRASTDLIGTYHMLFYARSNLYENDFRYWIKGARESINNLVKMQTEMETILNAEYATKAA